MNNKSSSCRLHIRTACGLFVFALLVHANLFAQGVGVGELQAFGGKVQLQREGQRVWDRANKKDSIRSGDLIKTGYKSFSILKLGEKNKVVLGSSTRALLELLPGASGKMKITLFEGGIYFTWPEGAGAEIYTNDGLFQTQKGTFTALYSKEDKKTLFVNMDGNQQVQSIIKKEPIALTPGQFSFIEAEQNPTPANQITTEVADKLRVFFGDNFINKEFEKYKIQVSVNATQKVDASSPAVEKETPYEESIRVAPFFNIQDMLKKIREIDGLETQLYQPPYWYDDQQNYTSFLEIKARMLNLTSSSVASTNPYGMFVRTGMRRNNWAFGFNLPLESGVEGGLQINTFSSATGLLDKIYFIDYQNERGTMSIHFGQIRDYTLGKGLLVYRFSNEIKGQIEQPLGFVFQYTPMTFLDISAFVPDLAHSNITGFHTVFDNGWTSLGGSVVIDWNQGEGFTFADKAFRSSEIPNDSMMIPSKTGAVTGWETFAQFNFIEEDDISAFGYTGVAMIHSGGKVQGAVVQIPAINVIWGRLSGYLEGILTFDHTHWGYFNEYYLEDRVRIWDQNVTQGPNNNPITIDSTYALSATEIHPPMAISKGFRTGVEWQIMDRLWLGLGYGQNFANSYIAENIVRRSDSLVTPVVYFDSSGTPVFGRTIKIVDSIPDTLAFIPTNDRVHYQRFNWNHSVQFRLFAGNDLISNLKRFETYYNLHGGWFGREMYLTPDYMAGNARYPFVDKVGESFYLSLGSTFGMLLEYQIMQKSSILAEFKGYSFDFNSNGIFDSDDLIMEFALSWRSNF